MSFRIHDVFSSNMVLQRDRPILVTGYAEPRSDVFVSFQGRTSTGISRDDGSWSLQIGPFSATSAGSALSAGYGNGRGIPEMVLENLVVGDVWFGSGQSNMEMGLGMAENGKREARDADIRQIRYFLLNKTSAPQPTAVLDAEWKVCASENVLSGGWEGFSALGYYFSKRLTEELGIPIGFIQSAYGGSKIHPWIQPDVLKRYESLKEYYDEWSMAESAYAQNPLADHPFSPYTEWDVLKPSTLYNAMVYPFLPFPVKGILWYQGESNVGDGPVYTERLEAVAETFRKSWMDSHLPFFIAQIAPYAYEKLSDLPDLWQAQYDAVDRIPNSGLVVTADYGDVDDIHPVRKKPVGERFAELALRSSYGKAGALRLPSPVGAAKEDGKGSGTVRINFSSGVAIKPCGNDSLSLFEVEGPSGIRYEAEARITGKTIEVMVPEGVSPVYVLYAWRGDITFLELYCEDGNPVRPFRIKCV